MVCLQVAYGGNGHDILCAGQGTEWAKVSLGTLTRGPVRHSSNVGWPCTRFVKNSWERNVQVSCCHLARTHWGWISAYVLPPLPQTVTYFTRSETQPSEFGSQLPYVYLVTIEVPRAIRGSRRGESGIGRRLDTTRRCPVPPAAYLSKSPVGG